MRVSRHLVVRRDSGWYVEEELPDSDDGESYGPFESEAEATEKARALTELA